MSMVPDSLDRIKAEEIQFNMMVKRSEILARSTLLPSSLRNKAADILIIMMMAQELNIPPLQALNGINVIQGKPVISPQLMIALIRSKVPNSYIEIVEREGECKCLMSRDKEDKNQIYTSTWTLERAQEMGIASKDNWKKQAGTMLKWRAVGDCARTVFPDILSGLYFASEFQDGTLNIDENGELKGILPKEEPIVVEQSKSYREFREKLLFITDKGKNKEKLNQILGEFGYTLETAKEMAALSDEVLLDMTIKLDEYKG